MVVRPDRDPPLGFMHVPKTAGTTMRTQLRRQYGWDRVLELQPNNPECNFETLAAMTREEVEHYRAFAGHWGIEWAPRLPAGTRLVTILRRPLHRIVSLYRHIWRDTSHQDHAWLREKRLTLGEFVRSGITTETDNSQVRFLAGAPPDEPVSEDMLREALANLDAFAVVGITERFDESLVLMRRTLGWRWPFYARENVRPMGGGQGIITPQCRRVVEETNSFAQRLYEHALARFDSQVAAPEIRAQVRTFRRLNRLYHLYYRLRYGAWSSGIAASGVWHGVASGSPQLLLQ